MQLQLIVIEVHRVTGTKHREIILQSEEARISSTWWRHIPPRQDRQLVSQQHSPRLGLGLNQLAPGRRDPTLHTSRTLFLCITRGLVSVRNVSARKYFLRLNYKTLTFLYFFLNTYNMHALYMVHVNLQDEIN